jgi:hypothetical protein
MAQDLSKTRSHAGGEPGAGEAVRDPVCGMDVDPARAAARVARAGRAVRRPVVAAAALSRFSLTVTPLAGPPSPGQAPV